MVKTELNYFDQMLHNQWMCLIKRLLPLNSEVLHQSALLLHATIHHVYLDKSYVNDTTLLQNNHTHLCTDCCCCCWELTESFPSTKCTTIKQIKYSTQKTHSSVNLDVRFLKIKKIKILSTISNKNGVFCCTFSSLTSHVLSSLRDHKVCFSF